MARKPREHALSGRVSDAKYEQVVAYTDAADIGIADLVRDAVDEYIKNHPVTKSEAE